MIVEYVSTRIDIVKRCAYEEFIQLLKAGDSNTLSQAVDKLEEQIMLKNPSEIPNIDEEPEAYDLWRLRLERKFIMTDNLKDNWNTYSESWTSPRGVVPIIEIIEVK